MLENKDQIKQNFQEQRPTLYTLELIPGDMEGKQIQIYHPPEPVTRENFINFFVKSFAVSRGKLYTQLLFFEWIKGKTGFDYRSLFGQMKDKKEMWDFFSSNEQ